MLPFTRKAFVVALVAGTASFTLPTDAQAATADVFAEGREYCATTHPNHGTIGGFGAAIDMNGKQDDYGWPVYAPGEGRVGIYSSGGGFGNSIIWTSANGRERIHMAHLGSFGRTGPVRAGDQIGRVGSTGHSTGSHLHAAASVGGSPAALVLHGEVIEPGRCYTSRGPIPPRCLGRDATALGTPGHDRLVGSPADDVFFARGGRDVGKGRGGDDAMCGGSGTDRLIGGLGADDLGGGGADDVLRGGPGGDRMGGAAGPDVLKGAARRDLLAGGRGEDLLVGGGGGDKVEGQGQGDRAAGGPGGDVLSGGQGKDALQGGKGGDRLQGNDDADRLAGDAGHDGLVGGSGEDDAIYARSAGGVVASLALGTATGQGQDSLGGIEGLIGSRYDDSLVGDAAANQLFGGAGADRTDGGGGDDLVDGGIGPDTLVGGLGLDLASYWHSDYRVEASLEQKQATTSEATDSLDGFEALRGSQRGDTLTGDAEDNSIYGEDGDDTLNGLGGENRLDGGAGFDTCLNGATTDLCEG